MMKPISLGKKGVVCFVDDEDYMRLSQWKWYPHYSKNNRSYYAFRISRKKEGEKRNIWMHREILGFELKDGRLGDHINRNTLDNRRENLREATPASNCWNRRRSKNNTSAYVGVSYDKRYRRWVAQIVNDGKYIFIGCSFPDAISAARAYDHVALKLRGERAVLNFPNEMRVQGVFNFV